MKKKLTVVSLVLVLLAIAVGGSLAYFMDSDEATNVFTIGSVEIEQHEQQRKKDTEGNYTSELEAFVQNKQLIPVGSNATAKSDKNFQDKIVTVQNKGKNDAYVQTFVAVPKALADAGVLHIYNNGATTYGWTKSATTYTVAESAIVDGGSAAEYTVYKYTYNSTLAAGATTDAAIEGVYIDQATDMDVTYAADGTTIQSAYFTMNNTTITGFDANGSLNVYVATQAIQADGFADASAALANFANHPWM